MKTKFLYLFAILTFQLITSCSKDDDNEIIPEPSIENIEIGSGNNGQGIIGRDFHFDMDVVAGELIETIQLKIEQKNDETYSREWSFEISWEEYNGLKNTNVHKHFDIPEEAPEGHYDLVIKVKDQNGTSLEEKREVELVDPANLPVDPELYLWSTANSNGDSYFVNETLENPENIVYAKNDTLTSNIQIQNVKNDGIMYLLLIKKDFNHLPESVDAINFSKAIVFDVYEHKAEQEVYTFWNTPYNSEIGDYERWPELIIGAENDNNAPESNRIEDDKAWENGEYYFGVVYTNTTNDVSIHHYLELEIVGF